MREFSLSTISRLARLLSDLRHRFERAADILVADLEDHAATAEVRDAMDLAGRILIRLVTTGIVAPPARPHSWLQFSTTRSSARIRFSRIRYSSGMGGSWRHPCSLRELIGGVIPFWGSLGQADPLRPREFCVGPTRHRLVFLEALAFWLPSVVPGLRRVDSPTIRVAVRLPGAKAEVDIPLVLEWSDRDDAHRALYLEVARSGAHACRHLQRVVTVNGVLGESARTREGPGVEEHSAEAMGLPQRKLATCGQAGAELTTKAELAVTSKPGRILQGWREILQAMGFDGNTRRRRDMVKRVNRESQGPIAVVGDKSVVADEAKLLSWWNTRITQAEAARDRQPDQGQGGASELELPGARIEQGFHVKSPRKRRGRS